MADVLLFTDGSFFFGKAPTFGWVAAAGPREVITCGKGVCANDGTNNVAGEINAAIEALTWAVGQGFRRIVLHADLASLRKHFHPGERKNAARKDRATSAAAARWLAEHPDVVVEFVFVRDTESPLLRRAHDLSRSAYAA